MISVTTHISHAAKVSHLGFRSMRFKVWQLDKVPPAQNSIWNLLRCRILPRPQGEYAMAGTSIKLAGVCAAAVVLAIATSQVDFFYLRFASCLGQMGCEILLKSLRILRREFILLCLQRYVSCLCVLGLFGVQQRESYGEKSSLSLLSRWYKDTLQFLNLQSCVWSACTERRKV